MIEQSSRFTRGVHDLAAGLRLAMSPGLRQFILMPFFINVALFSLMTWWVVGQFDQWLNHLLDSLPHWLVAISHSVIAILFGILLTVTMGVSFVPIANVFAAPFNGLLAERTLSQIAGVTPPEESLLAMTFRSIGRELRKLAYFMPRALLVLLATFTLSFVPLLNLVAPALGFLWGAWYMTLQYIDYCEDNHRHAFAHTIELMREQRARSFGFGTAVMMMGMVPVLNWFAIPASVCGGTHFWAATQGLLAEQPQD